MVESPAALATVSNQQAEQLLDDLVAIPSPSGREEPAAMFLTHWLGQHGFENRLDHVGNAVGVRGRGDREILLLGHIDTVPGFPPVRVRGRRLYGRGAVDAKGPLAAMAVAAARIPPPVGWRWVVAGAVEEEDPSSRGARFLLANRQPTACLVGEPSRWDRITLGYKGSLRLTWAWQGPLAHPAGPVASPPEVAIADWEAIRAYAEQVNGVHPGRFDSLDPTLVAIDSGRDGAQGWARMEISLRLPPGMASAEIEQGLQSLELAGSLRAHPHSEAVVASKNSAVARALLAAIRAEGGRPRFVHKSGTSDMNLAGPAWGCPIAAYGPGNSRLDHTPDEYIDLDEYLRSISVLERALQAITADPPDRH